MLRDGVNDKKFVVVLAPAARTADANGDIDLLNGGDLADKCTILVDMGIEGIVLSGTDKIEVVVTHGDAPGPTTPVTLSDLIIPNNAAAGILAAPDVNGKVLIFDGNADIPGLFAFGYRGGKRYVNVKLDFSGTHGAGTPSSVLAILEGLAFRPAA